MSAPVTNGVVKGWCPDAWRPMMAGDGLLVRVRPPLGRLTRTQIVGLCEASTRFGNGQLDTTTRANLQIRGVREDSWRPLIDALLNLGLIDPDPTLEGRANILVAPEWRAGDATHLIAQELRARLSELPSLPGKVGFAIDAGVAPTLRDAPADFRIERAATGQLILRADGRHRGTPLVRGTETDHVIALAHWFGESGGAASGRMARHDASLPEWAAATTLPAVSAQRLKVGEHPFGIALGLPFGRVAATALIRLVDGETAVEAIRLTPWHIVICEADTPLASLPEADFIADPSSPLLRADACVGAPACPQATIETRTLARRLAPYVAGSLHVSGCGKGCARAAPAAVTLTGREGRYDLAFDARAGASPSSAGLDAAQILAHFGAAWMPYAYETDGAAIYRQSFAMIRAEADLDRFSSDQEPVAVRMIHAAGLVGLAQHIRFSPTFAVEARRALRAGAPILCDARMVTEGITRARLPADNRIVCTLHAPETPDLARTMGNTRSAAALELWRPHLAGAVVAIGNAPTALFHLLNMLEDPDCPRPAAIIGCPVGFVGAVESKAALWADQPVPCVVVEGRMGGSAITVAAINALASGTE